ncbi:Precorrin-6A reductase [Rhizobium sp. EC-SD404]|nr:cobalt-precorrin-6A reductase [Rhizobium sp. EC-SD404]VVT25356.1 Precorrin-6A reductase [Rhizobium sp. EC-SD404]
MPAVPETILILGGTREAAELAARLAASGKARIVTSLAGRTREPKPLAGETRVGGFGGAEGLAAYIKDNAVDLVIDATHPFAGTISANAGKAADFCAIPLISLARPAWQPVDGDRWKRVATIADAVTAIPTDATVLLALGRQHIAPFAGRSDVTFVIRMIDEPESDLPFERAVLVLGKPDLDVDAEEAMLAGRGIDMIVCRNSGGRGAYAKIEAARRLGLPVLMIDRPPNLVGLHSYASVEALLGAELLRRLADPS